MKFGMLVVNAWHVCFCGVVAGGVYRYRREPTGVPMLDPIAAAIVGLMVARMGWRFGWYALYELLGRAIDEGEAVAIQRTLLDT